MKFIKVGSIFVNLAAIQYAENHAAMVPPPPPTNPDSPEEMYNRGFGAGPRQRAAYVKIYFSGGASLEFEGEELERINSALKSLI